jgi:uncharacterized membrane protein
MRYTAPPAAASFTAGCPAPYSGRMTSSSPVFLDVVLAPHRSLPIRGFNIMMAIFGGVSFVYGMAFLVLLHAWPVFCFFGIDVFLVWLAFRLNYRSARQSEHVRLVEDSLTVERTGVRGEQASWRFQPYWLRVIFEEQDEHTNRLLITSHGRSLTLAAFLGPEQRRDFALSLKDALARWRRHWQP